MRKKRIPDILRKQSIPISLSKHVIDALKRNENRSEVVEQILLENMDRINGGCVEEAAMSHEVYIRGLVAKVIRENEYKIMEMERGVDRLQEVVSSLKEVNEGAKEGSNSLHTIAQEVKKISKAIDVKKYRMELGDELVERIYKETGEYAEGIFKF